MRSTRFHAVPLALVTLAALPIAACDHAPTAPGAMPAPSWLASAPLVLTEGPLTMRLEATAWRDFMPISPTDGGPLTVVLRLRTTTGAPLPPGLGIDSVWVVYERLAWASQPEATSAPWGPEAIEYVVRGGPKWGPDVGVDVIASVTGLAGGPKRIATRQVMVERTD